MKISDDNKPLTNDELTSTLSYTGFILNIRKLLSSKKKSKRQTISFKLDKKKRESNFTLALRKCIVEAMDYSKVIDFLKKDKSARSKQEIKAVAEFLALTNNFFRGVQSNDVEKLYNLVNVLNIEHFSANQNIISYGEEGDKFYIVLEGKVGVYKPKFVEKEMTHIEFYLYLNSLFDNKYLYYRVLKKNCLNTISDLNIDTITYMIKKTFYVEENEIVFEGDPGTSFGEVALIQKTKRNATITALTNAEIATIDKDAYHSLMRMFEAKKFYGNISKMRADYIIIKNWSTNMISKLLNSFITLNIIKGEYLYHQGDQSDSIYFAINGSFETYTTSSIKTSESLINQIRAKPKHNVISWIKKRVDPVEIETINEFIEECCEWNHKMKNPIVSKLDMVLEDEKKFKIILKNDKDIPDVFGVEDAFELKRRNSSVVVTSINAEVKKISLNELILLICKGFKVSVEEFDFFITERKNFFISQIEKAISLKKRKLKRKLNFSLNFDTKIGKSKTEKKMFQVSHLKKDHLQNHSNRNSHFNIRKIIRKNNILGSQIFSSPPKISHITNIRINYFKKTKISQNTTSSQYNFSELSTSYKNTEGDDIILRTTSNFFHKPNPIGYEEKNKNEKNLSKTKKKNITDVENEINKITGVYNSYRKIKRTRKMFCPKICIISPLRLNRNNDEKANSFNNYFSPIRSKTESSFFDINRKIHKK